MARRSNVRRTFSVGLTMLAFAGTVLGPGRASGFPLLGEECPGARPGAVLINDGAAGPDPRGFGTFGFTFHGSDGGIYTSTAGHVILGLAPGEEAWPPGDGLGVRDLDGNRIGEYVYAINTRTGSNPELPSGADLALIRVDEDVTVGAAVCDLGLPTGIDTRIVPPTEPIALRWYGAAFVGGRVGPPLPVPVDNFWLLPSRSGIALGMPSAERVAVVGHASFGDSGAPVLTGDGGAVGLISGPPRSSEDFQPVGHAGLFIVPRLSPALARASEVLGIDFALATSV